MRKTVAYKGHCRCTTCGCRSKGRREADSIASSFKERYVQNIREDTAYRLSHVVGWRERVDSEGTTGGRAMPDQAATVRHNLIMKRGLDLIGSSNNKTVCDVKVFLPDNQREARMAADGLDGSSLHSEEQCSGIRLPLLGAAGLRGLSVNLSIN